MRFVRFLLTLTSIILMIAGSIIAIQRQFATRAYWIAYTDRDAVSRQNIDIFIMEANGDDRRQLTFDPYEDLNPTWSPDGFWLLFESRREWYYNLYKIRFDGKLLTPLTDSRNGEHNRSAAWSPDGEQIVYVVETWQTSDLFIMDKNGRHRYQLTTLEGVESSPQWTPDGAWIVFVGAVQYELRQARELYKVRPDGSDLTPLTSLGKDVYNPSLSPDGRWLTFVTRGVQSWDIFILNMASGEIQTLVSNPVNDNSPVWSPEGDYLTYVTTPSGTSHLYRIDPDGGNVRLLAYNVVQTHKPTWSPYGDWLIFSSYRRGRFELYRVRPDGSDLELLAPTYEESVASWSAGFELPARAYSPPVLGLGLLILTLLGPSYVVRRFLR